MYRGSPSELRGRRDAFHQGPELNPRQRDKRAEHLLHVAPCNSYARLRYVPWIRPDSIQFLNSVETARTTAAFSKRFPPTRRGKQRERENIRQGSIFRLNASALGVACGEPCVRAFVGSRRDIQLNCNCRTTVIREILQVWTVCNIVRSSPERS